MKANSFYAKYIKRFLDIVVSVLGIVVISPFLLIIAAAIIISSGTPIVYKQIRVGKNGNKFEIFKFRTMINGADKQGTSTQKNDSRITGIGKILRKTSLDELPQLINVIKGQMSLIGFRPDVPRDTSDFSQKKWCVKPGITGYAQVNGRSAITLEKLSYWENRYADDISFMTDVKILLKTVSVVLRKADSY